MTGGKIQLSTDRLVTPVSNTSLPHAHPVLCLFFSSSLDAAKEATRFGLLCHCITHTYDARRWEKGEDHLHMSQLLGNNEAVGTHKRFPGRLNTLLAIRCQRDVGRTRVTAIE